jgi:cyclopropane fatty-acyl-phospholipid synthase-like methyltransferase
MEQALWNQLWARQGFSPAWLLESPPEEVRQAVQSRWFPPGARVLDIGCGNGAISAWLASQGFHVLGIDFAISAIRRAELRHKNVTGSLDWRLVDICREVPDAPPFEVLIDRGCLHGIPPDLVPFYVRHISACSTRDARLLLIHKTAPASSGKLLLGQKISEVSKLIEFQFQSIFEILQVTPTVLQGSSEEKQDQWMAGLVFRMVRKH